MSTDYEPAMNAADHAAQAAEARAALALDRQRFRCLSERLGMTPRALRAALEREARTNTIHADAAAVREEDEA